MKKGVCLLIFSLAFNFGFSQTLQSVTDLDNKTSNALRVTGSNNLIGGPALELYYHEGRGSVVSHDRQTNQFKPLYIEALTTSILNGNVGIGTASPAYKLDVNGSMLTRGEVMSSMDEDGGGRLTLVNPRKTANGIASVWKIFNMTGSYGNSLQFWAYDNAGCGAGLCENRFTILDNGNVGVGTMNPAYKLDVNGDGKFLNLYTQGEVSVGGSIGFRDRSNSNKVWQWFANANSANLYNTTYGGNIMSVNETGNVGIGTANPQTKFAVNGDITTKKIKVTQIGWADYVFDSSYQLTPLAHVETFIKENKHLPEVPSAAEVKKDGLDLGDNQVLLLKKIEELTLYIIQQNKEIVELKKRMSEMEEK